MKQYIFCLIGLCGLSLSGVAQSSISLDDLINQAKENNPQSSQLALIDELSDLKMKKISGANLPQSSLGGQATWQSDVTSIDISLPGIDIQPPPKDQYKITLDVQQNIWDGGLSAGQKSMEMASREVESRKVLTDLYKVEEQVSGLYFAALFADRQRANAALILKELDSKITQVKAAVENGVAIKSDLLNLEARKIELAQSLSEIENKKTAALKALSILSGRQIREDQNLEIPEFTKASNTENQRPELWLLTAQQNAILASKKIIKAKNAPKLGLFATGGYGRPGLNFLAKDFSPYMIGGLSLKIPLSHLYNGGQTNDLQQIKVNQLKMEMQKRSFLMASEVKYTHQKSEIERLESLITSDSKLIAIREQIRNTADAQLANGVIIANEYLTELNKEDLAKQALILHEVQLLQAKQILKLILGQ
ncbi:MAG: outer membrane protein TolC [Arcticibacterium sp.]|jgi:outer membrane protein TolC